MRRCNLKIKSFSLFVACVGLVLLLKTTSDLYAQMMPPIPPTTTKDSIPGSEGAILKGSEGTLPKTTSPPAPVFPSQGRVGGRALPPVTGRTAQPSTAIQPQQSQTPLSPIQQPGTRLQPSGTPLQSGTPPQPGLQQTPAKASDRMVTLDFNNVDLQTFIKFISELTGKNFVLDEKVQGKVTVISPTKISIDEAYHVFLTVLDLKGFTAIAENKIIKIFPSREAKQSGVSIVTDTKPLPPDENYETRVIRLKYISATEIARLMAPLISKDGSSIPYSQTNTLILTDITSNMEKLLKLIEELDIESPKGKGGIYVYYLQNASAEEMAKVLANLTSRIPAKPPAGQAPQEAVVHFEGGISVTADKATNSLIIMASPEDYERMTSIIERLDVKRKQVFVEAAIVEMSLDKTRELGIEWRTTENPSATGYTIAGGTLLAPTGIKEFSVNPLSVNGLVVAGVKGFLPDGKTLNVGALLRAFQSDTDVNILSTPNILTLDNQEAKIIVGQNVPFITGTSQTAGGNVQATIERKDVGIQLKITPHTTESDFVRLDIYQEISSLGGSIPVGTDQEVPITNKRSAETSVVVKNLETVVIGGLIKDDVTVTERKVPILGDLPVLGYLFKYQSRQKTKTNLIIFLSPHIIRDSETLGKISYEKRRRSEEFRERYHFELKDDFILNPPSDGQPDIQPNIQPNIQPDGEPYFRPYSQPDEQPDEQIDEQIDEQPGGQPDIQPFGVPE